MEGSFSSSSDKRPINPSNHNVPTVTENQGKEALPKQSEESLPVSLISSNWPSLPSESGSPIPPGQKSQQENPSPWKIKQKSPDEYEKDRMGKYVYYFRGNEILPIPELVEKLEPRIVSLVVTDLKTRRLVGLKKEGFEDLQRKAGVPCQYFCRRSFATWDVRLPSSNQAAKVASSNIMTKFFRLQPEYLGPRRIRVTICNVPAFLTGEVLAAFLSSYGSVEEITLLRSAAGTAYGDYVFRMCLTREGFQAIPETIVSRERQIMVIVEGRRPRCWSCKQLGHISKFCPKKDRPQASAAAAATIAREAVATTVSTVPISESTTEKKQATPKTVEEWIEVNRKKKKKSPQKSEDKSSSVKEVEPAAKKTTSSIVANLYKSVTAPILAYITHSQSSHSPQPPELAHHPPQPTKTRPHQIARSQSHDRLSKEVC